MSHQAVATVTATLTHILSQGIEHAVYGQQNVGVTHEQISKFKEGPGDSGHEAWINIYAYQVESDPALRNDDLPTRGQNGILRQRPQVALNISYLMTFYGDEKKLEPQQLLGWTVGKLHANPVIVPGIPNDEIAEFQTSYPFATDPNLTGQKTHVRMTPLPLSLEDLSKIWSVFFHTEYHLSVTYQASVVLITEDEPEPQPVLPVRQRQLFVLPSSGPVIDSVLPQTVPPGGPLTIRGQHIQANQVQVIFNDLPPVTPDQNTGGLVVRLPDTLPAGVNTVRLEQTVNVGAAGQPEPRRVSESNAMAFVLQPVIEKVAGAKSTLTLTVKPKVQPQQSVTLWLDEQMDKADLGAAQTPYTYGLTPKDHASATDTLQFDISKVNQATYQLRLRIDRAESLAKTWELTADTVETA